MPMYTVDSEEVQTKASSIQATVGRMQSDNQGCCTDSSPTCSDRGPGQAAAAFQASAEEWRSVQVRLDEALTALGAALAAAGPATPTPSRAPSPCSADNAEGAVPSRRKEPPLEPGGSGLQVHATLSGRLPERPSLLRLVRDDGLGRQEQTSDRCGVLQRRTRDLGRVDDARACRRTPTGRGVETVARRAPQPCERRRPARDRRSARSARAVRRCRRGRCSRRSPRRP